MDPLEKERLNQWLVAMHSQKMVRNIDKTNLTELAKESFKVLIKEVPQEYAVDVYRLAMAIGMPDVFGKVEEVGE